jgi:hypothetical protein
MLHDRWSNEGPRQRRVLTSRPSQLQRPADKIRQLGRSNCGTAPGYVGPFQIHRLAEKVRHHRGQGSSGGSASIGVTEKGIGGCSSAGPEPSGSSSKPRSRCPPLCRQNHYRAVSESCVAAQKRHGCPVCRRVTSEEAPYLLRRDGGGIRQAHHLPARDQLRSPHTFYGVTVAESDRLTAATDQSGPASHLRLTHRMTGIVRL